MCRVGVGRERRHSKSTRESANYLPYLRYGSLRCLLSLSQSQFHSLSLSLSLAPFQPPLPFPSLITYEPPTVLLFFFLLALSSFPTLSVSPFIASYGRLAGSRILESVSFPSALHKYRVTQSRRSLSMLTTRYFCHGCTEYTLDRQGVRGTEENTKRIVAHN